MSRVIKQPVKAACLACRASKTRCDGRHPCQPCEGKQRSCVFQPSRRGGVRRNTKNDKPRPSVPSSVPPLISASVIDIPDDIPTSATEDPHHVDAGLQNILGLLTPLSGVQNIDVAPDLVWSPPDTSDLGEIPCPLLRVYRSEEDIANAYYVYIHPYLSLLPPPVLPPYDDRPDVFQRPPGELCTVNQSSLPYWPRSSLSLAISAIMALIPPLQDQIPLGECNQWLRREYAHLYAQAALANAEKEIDALALRATGGSPLEQGNLHPNVPSRLHPVLAFVTLSVYEYCQRGNIPRMRARANQAITTAMDLSLHNLGSTASEAQRRAWWASMFMVYLSSVLQEARPIIVADDPRITTPYPVFRVQPGTPEPWPLLIEVQSILLDVSYIVADFGLEDKTHTPSPNLREGIRLLDAHISCLAKPLDLYTSPRSKQDAEGLAALSMGMITHLFIHSARMKLHRFRAFLDIPIFFNKHCDLASIEDRGVPSIPSYPENVSPFESIFPFTEQESSIICLKSSLTVARILKALPSPNQYHPGHPQARHPLSLGYPQALPYFRCTTMQACYTLLMLLHRIRAAMVAKPLSTCYFLLSHPDPTTEVQDAERLMEELRHGLETISSSLRMDAVFEGVRGMGREVDTAYLSTFPDG